MNMMLIKYLSFIVIFVLCLVQDRLNLSLVLLSLLLASQLVMKQSWAKRHSQGLFPLFLASILFPFPPMEWR